MENRNGTHLSDNRDRKSNGLERPDRTQSATVRPTSAPLVDVYENDDEILVVADMPGARSDSINIRYEKDELSISARRDTDGSGQLLAGGRRDCEYRRAFLIPRGVDSGQITAEISNGVLKVRLPKSAAVKPRVIEVKAAN